MNERKYLGLFSVTSFVDGPEVAEAGRQSGPISDRHRHGSRNTESGGLGGAWNVLSSGVCRSASGAPRRLAGLNRPPPSWRIPGSYPDSDCRPVFRASTGQRGLPALGAPRRRPGCNRHPRVCAKRYLTIPPRVASPENGVEIGKLVYSTSSRANKAFTRLARVSFGTPSVAPRFAHGEMEKLARDSRSQVGRDAKAEHGTAVVVTRATR